MNRTLLAALQRLLMGAGFRQSQLLVVRHQRLDGFACLRMCLCLSSSEVIVVVGLLLLPARWLLLFAALGVHCVALALLGRVGDLGDDVVEEVELFVVGDGLLEMQRVDAFRIARLGFGGGFSDEGDHEQLECFGWEGSIM
jgi:hypothetical protein